MKTRFLFFLLIFPFACSDTRSLNNDEQFVIDSYLEWIQGDGYESLKLVLDTHDLITTDELIEYSITSSYVATDTTITHGWMAYAHIEIQTVKIYSQSEAWKTVILPNFDGQQEWWNNCSPSMTEYNHKMKITVSVLCHENAHFILGVGAKHSDIYDVDDQCTWAWMYYQSLYESSCKTR